MKRRGWDSNPRALADKRFSRPPRYDHFDTPARERVMGIEPTYPAWKAGVLPLNYTRIFNCSQVGVTGFEPATSCSQTRRSSQAEPHPDMLFYRFVFIASPKRLRYNITLFHTCQHFFTFFWNYFFKYDTSRVFTMFSITWNNSFTDSLNDLLTALSAVGNQNGQLCHGGRRPEDRPRAQVCIQACSKGQGRGHDEICVKIYLRYPGEILGNFGEIFRKKIFKF